MRSQLKAALEADPCVNVGQLTGDGRDMEIAIKVCQYMKAKSLATLLSKKYGYGPKLMVSVNVVSDNHTVPAGPALTTLDDTLKTIKSALTGNQFFVKIGSSPYVEQGFVEFKPAIVQYYSDDISDWYNNTNLTASDAFKQILDLKSLQTAGIFVTTTTSPIKK